MTPMRVGVIGCGMISAIYLENCTRMFDNLTVIACADLVPELAHQRAAEFGVPLACSVEELLQNPDVDVVLNLTPPGMHTETNLRALAAGKHVYAEKPFALTMAEAERVLAAAQERGLRVGIAPDTFLGGGLQTSRDLLAAGAIGTPYAANGLILMGNAFDGMHPRFETYFTLGWDPLFDMAPYYLTALVQLLGPVRRVSGTTARLRDMITVTNPQSPRYGDSVPVTAPQNTAATLEFAGGAIASLQAAKESFGYTPRLEIYGTEGILFAPDPNTFGGPIRIKRADGTLDEIAPSHGYTDNSRGLGLSDMADAIRTGRPHRASGDLARHVLEITLGVFESAKAGMHVTIGMPAAFQLYSRVQND
ncbi:MAG TPA: Gfo/Idh/MocA family oxidoreductase [Roseiflexaceae bacterium]|nr:Gfo/Idh/MocA family oxidoreductase [Roseiflexaceae bacterium]HMP42959.1 Gfo/Idh/MocA family oxidoreductase [Roseiflexaceae bacterium]